MSNFVIVATIVTVAMTHTVCRIWTKKTERSLASLSFTYFLGLDLSMPSQCGSMSSPRELIRPYFVAWNKKPHRDTRITFTISILLILRKMIIRTTAVSPNFRGSMWQTQYHSCLPSGKGHQMPFHICCTFSFLLPMQ